MDKKTYGIVTGIAAAVYLGLRGTEMAINYFRRPRTVRVGVLSTQREQPEKPADDNHTRSGGTIE